MNISKARKLLAVDPKILTLDQLQKHKVKLIDAWRHSKADYGFKEAVKEGFYLEIVDSGASGFSPRDIWLTHQLVARLDEIEARERELLLETTD